MHEDERERIETDSIRAEEARVVFSLAGRRYDLFVMVKEDRERPECPSCSRNAHPQKVLVRRAQRTTIWPLP
jgi:hypothetical protein